MVKVAGVVEGEEEEVVEVVVEVEDGSVLDLPHHQGHGFLQVDHHHLQVLHQHQEHPHHQVGQDQLHLGQVVPELEDTTIINPTIVFLTGKRGKAHTIQHTTSNILISLEIGFHNIDPLQLQCFLLSKIYQLWN